MPITRSASQRRFHLRPNSLQPGGAESICDAQRRPAVSATCPAGAVARGAFFGVRPAPLHSTTWLNSKAGRPRTPHHQLLPTHHLRLFAEQMCFSA